MTSLSSPQNPPSPARERSQGTPLLSSPHDLLHWEQPVLFLQRIFRVYPNEVKLLLWVTAIQLAMRISSIMINNYAQTAFLKRYGVEYLPTIFVVEAILTFFVTSVVGFLMDRHRTLRVFTGLLLFFALSIGIIRGLLPFEITLIYPVLYILKSQAVEILPILYWDILNDLFTTQQSKRLFTLVTAGGILGTTLGSFMTGTVARWVGVDNVLLVFVGGMVLAGLLNESTERVVGAPLEPRVDRRRGKDKAKFKESLQEFVDYSKRSPLLKYMVLITAIPNILLPILTYQFSVVVNDTYATEQATLHFFGVFRGVSNATMFGILLFSGRLLTRWGVATSLLFHPVNYLLSFLSLLFRFDIMSAVYARFTTETLKTTLNNPARAVLYNFFPAHMRGLIRVFLRGTVVRAADLSGSGLLMLIKGLMNPRLLSLVAAPMVLIWIFTNIKIKRSYSSLLIQLLMQKQVDWKQLEKVQFQALVMDKKTLEALKRGLRDEKPEVALLCGEVLAQVTPPGWSKSIVDALPGKPPSCQRALLDLLRPQDSEEIIDALIGLAREAPPETLVHLIPTLIRVDPKGSSDVVSRLADHPDLVVRAQALVGLACSGEAEAQQIAEQRVRTYLDEEKPGAGAVTEGIGDKADGSLSGVLLHWAKGKDPDLKGLALSGLGKIRDVRALEVALAAMEDPAPQIRDAALEVLTALEAQTPLQLWIHLLGHEDPKVRERASHAIGQRGEGIVQSLLSALASPSRILKKEVLSILGEMGAPGVELSQFMNRELERAYRNLGVVQSLLAVEGNKAVASLRDHLLEKNREILEVVLRVLAVHEFGDRMEVILKALQSGDRRDMDNAIEALETHLHSEIRKILIPVLQDIPLEEKLTVGEKRLKTGLLAKESPEKTLVRLLEDDDPVTQALVLCAFGEDPDAFHERLPGDVVLRYLDSKDSLVKDAARLAVLALRMKEPIEVEPVVRRSLIDRVLAIQTIPIFRNLRVRELAAIAAISSAESCPRGGVVVQEGDPGDALYLVLDGDLTIIKGLGTEREAVLDRIHKDDFFGEMALIDGRPRSAYVRAESDASLLVINARDFARIMEENPSIPIGICKIFCQRLRSLQVRLKDSKQIQPLG